MATASGAGDRLDRRALNRATLAEAWLGRPLAAAGSAEGMILRYLAAFGPASVADIQAWSGLTRLREPTERLGGRLRRFRDKRGRQLYDLPDAPGPTPGRPARSGSCPRSTTCCWPTPTAPG
jgi:hypothetical protein